MDDSEPTWAFVEAADRIDLLRDGVVVVIDGSTPAGRWVGVAGARWDALEVAVRRFGSSVDVELLGKAPREILPRRCSGCREREPGRLQLRYVLGSDEHIDEVVVEEDAGAVVVYATVCTPVAGRRGARCDGPCHVYLDRPLADRRVIDGVTGEDVPRRTAA